MKAPDGVAGRGVWARSGARTRRSRDATVAPDLITPLTPLDSALAFGVLDFVCGPPQLGGPFLPSLPTYAKSQDLYDAGWEPQYFEKAPKPALKRQGSGVAANEMR